MKQKFKTRGLEAWLSGKSKAVICLSGGVDSCALLVYSADILGAKNVSAFAGTAPYMFDSELKFARSMCKKLGVKLREGDVCVSEIMQSNPLSRCFLCKRAIFAAARDYADEIGADCVLDGTNYDDMGESRPGEAAKAEFGIESPFAKFCVIKSEIRSLLFDYGYADIARKPSATCFMTRLPVGASATQKDFRDIEGVESFLRSEGFDFVRARKFADKIEIQIPRNRLRELTSGAAAEKLAQFMASKGIENFGVSGYQFGYMQRK